MSEENIEIETIEVEEDVAVGAAHRVESYQELLDCLYDADVRQQFWRNVYEKTEADLWLNTDWEEVFKDKKPTVKDKEMFVKQELQEAKELRDSCKMDFDDWKRMYDIALKYGLEALQ